MGIYALFDKVKKSRRNRIGSGVLVSVDIIGGVLPLLPRG